MKTFQEIKQRIDNTNGGYVDIIKDLKFQIYGSGISQGALFHKDRAIVKLEYRNDTTVTVSLPKEHDNRIIDYGKSKQLINESPVTSIFDFFKENDDIERVVAGLLLFQ